jgi:hypothetical protein
MLKKDSDLELKFCGIPAEGTHDLTQLTLTDVSTAVPDEAREVLCNSSRYNLSAILGIGLPKFLSLNANENHS